jgi:hypothetical protein
MLLEEAPQLLVDDALDDPLDLRRHQLVLGLVAELRIGVLDRHDRGQPLADVVAAEPVFRSLSSPAACA